MDTVFPKATSNNIEQRHTAEKPIGKVKWNIKNSQSRGGK